MAKNTITQAEQNAQVADLKAQRRAVKDKLRTLDKGSDEFKTGKVEAQRLHDEIEKVRTIPVAEAAAG